MASTPWWLQFAIWKPRRSVSIAIFIISVGAMGHLRLSLFPHEFVTLTYALPLLICLWYPSKRLLWAMTAAFVAMATYKAFVLLPRHQLFLESNSLHWGMQVVNTMIVATTVHLGLSFMERLRRANTRLQESNEKLCVRDEEISRQNEELASQNEELAAQNEEIQQQAEELQHQAQELNTQSQELQLANAELVRRRELLENLLRSLQDVTRADTPPAQLCVPVLQLFNGVAVAAVLTRQEDDDVVVQGHAGVPGLQSTRWPLAGSFASIVQEQDRVAGVADLALRPDLAVAQPASGGFRAVLAAPLRLGGHPAGTIEVYSDAPYNWTCEQFQILEWGAGQCSLVLEVRRLHQELLAANARLDRQVQTRTAELQELVHELEHFSYTITHDLRAPLRAMHGFAQFLEEEAAGKLDEQSRGYLKRIEVAARRMDQLISDALSYSKAVRLDLNMIPMDPVRLLRGMIESYPAFQPPKAQIELPDQLPTVVANEAALTQCFSNLLDNAVKFVPPGRTPHVRIRAEERDGMVRLWFEDNGIGIPRDLHGRLFVMFQRLSKDYEGTGIGLALVRKVAERMGGRVGVESDSGQGSRFWLELKRVG